MIPYSELHKTMLKRCDFGTVFPKNATFSVPVPVKREDRLYDAVFVYEIEYSGKAPLITRPFCWIMLAADGGSDMMYSWCNIIDFIATESYPIGATLAADLPKALSPKKVEQITGDIMRVYEQIRSFVFEETLNREQVGIIVQYKELFLKLCFSGLYPFYHAISPAFFHWLRLPLPEMKKAYIPEDLANTHEYQYQLLILETLQQMVGQFHEKIQTDNMKQKLFEEMHSELQEYKNGLVESVSLSLERDIIQLIDSMERSLKSFEDQPPTEDGCRRLLKLFDGIGTDLEDILYRQGVDPYETTGDEIQVPRQKVITTVLTDNPALDKKLAARLAPGWEKNGRIIRAEHVSAYLYTESDKGE